MLDDSALLSDFARKGSQASFTELVRRHLDFVYAVALRQLSGNSALAQDVTQRVFIDLARKAGHLARHPALIGWLHTATRHAAGAVLRSEIRRRRYEADVQVIETLQLEPAAPVAWDTLAPLIDDVLGALKERERTAILLRFFQGYRFSEVGARLHLSEDGARACVDRALDKMRRLLAQRGICSSVAMLGVALASHVGVAAPLGLAATVTQSAAAGAAASPAITLASIMSGTKLGFGATALALALVCGIGVVVIRQRIAAETAVRAMQHAVASLQADLRRARNDSPGNPRNGVRPAGPDAAAQAGEIPRDPVAAGKKYAQDHPETPKAIATYADEVVRVRFLELFQRLGLTAEQVAQFRAVAYQMDSAVQWNTASQIPRAEIKVGDLSQAEIDRELQAILGDPKKYQAYQDHLAELKSGARRPAEQLARVLFDSDEPLTSEQARQLTQMTARAAQLQGSDRPGGSRGTPWDEILQEAPSILTAAQLTALTTLRDRANFDRATSEAIREAMAAAKVQAGLPPNL